MRLLHAFDANAVLFARCSTQTMRFAAARISGTEHGYFSKNRGLCAPMTAVLCKAPTD